MKLRRLLPALLLLTPGLTAAEEAPLYDIELIIFANLVNNDGAERWDTEPVATRQSTVTTPSALDGERRFNILGFPAEPMPEPAEPRIERAAPEPVAATPLVQPFWKALTREERQLGNIYGAMRRSATYRPLAHLAWRQPVQEPADALTIPLMALTNPGRYYGAESTRDPVTGPSSPDPLEGAIQVSVARYLHVHLDLQYRPEDEVWEEQPRQEELDLQLQQPGATLVTSWVRPVFELKETRRMRSTELHYFDHPRFGVLVEIRPYTPPEITETADTEAASDATAAPPGPQPTGQ